jgi:L-ascorbate metabolism protein UlaG (beta-lactamase superfamily)
MSVEISWIGHACFEIVAPDVKILVDPFLSPHNPAATKTAADFSPDIVALTHGHEDHVADVLSVVSDSGAELIAMVEIANWYQSNGVEKVVDLNLGGTASYDWGSVQLVPALHTNTLPDGTVIGQAAGLVITAGGARIYHTGDTALFSDLALAKRRAPVDVAIVPIGGHYTMDPDDAAEAVRLIEPKHAIPCHYNTFPVIEQDPARFVELVSAQTSAEPVILKPDESFRLG